MLTKTEIMNMRVFLSRNTDVRGNETVAHANCLIALNREEQEIMRLERHIKIEADAAGRATTAEVDTREATQVLPKADSAQ